MLGKRKKAKMLDDQFNRCACCGEVFSPGQRACYNPTTNTLICCPCNLFFGILPKALDKGLSLDKLLNYNETPKRPRMVSTTTVGKRARKALYTHQNGRCACCGREFQGNERYMHDSHKHALVCNTCMMCLHGLRSMIRREVSQERWWNFLMLISETQSQY